MRLIHARLLGLLVLLAFFLPTRPVSAQADDTKPTFWIIPHTHWEGAVFKTREEYLQMGLPHILHALDLLRTQPDYTFVLDQVAYVRPFLERYPDQVADFKRFVKEGRLELVLGLDVMPDVNMPGGETFVRQMLYGKDYYRKEFGKDVTAGWLIDTFGFHAQMPQLLKQGGYTSFWHQRGVNRLTHPSEYFWEGLDGTRIAAFWMPRYYSLMYGSPKELPAFRDFVMQRFSSLDPNSKGPHRLALSGVDVCEPEPHLAPMVAQYNKQTDAALKLKLAVPTQFEAAIDDPNRPVFKGELNPIFQGTYSSRIELKAWMRDMEARLTQAEKLAAIAHCLGLNVEQPDLMAIWEPVMFNQTHDLASGVMTDHVYEDVIRTYEAAKARVEQETEKLWHALEGRIDTSGEGIPIVVFNPLGFERDDLVEIDLEPDTLYVRGFKLIDSDGDEVPFQLAGISDKRVAPGKVRLSFLARRIPSVGYATYRLVPADGLPPLPASPESTHVLESDLYRVTLDPTNGAVTSIVVKKTNEEVLSGLGNVISRKLDKGDLWELGRGLDGGSNVAMTGKQPVPKKGEAKRSTDDHTAIARLIVRGPVFFECDSIDTLDNGTVRTNIRVINGLQRVEFTTTIVNKEKYVHYQALFPTKIRNGKNVQEIPFGAIERPIGVEMPAQNWSAYEDGEHGVALLNHGLPGNFVSEDTLVVSLLRSHNLGAYGFGGGYEPGMSSETGFQVGIPRTMRYALVPYEGTWQSARIDRAGQAFNQPLIARVTKPHAGTLPPRWGLLGETEVNLSALKIGKNNQVILRFYEPLGHAVEQAISWNAAGIPAIKAARAVNLMEDAGAPIDTDGKSLRLAFRPFEIKTIALELAPE